MGGPKQRGWNDPSLWGSMLDELIGSGAKRVVETAKRVAPKCGYCGQPTLVRCMNCGQYVCRAHGFVNAPAFDKINVLCSGCISQHFPYVTVEPPPGARYHPQDDNPWPHETHPWDVLGVSPYAEKEEIEAARKSRAREVHPDKAKNEQERLEREKAMKLVNAAAEWMLAKKGDN